MARIFIFLFAAIQLFSLEFVSKAFADGPTIDWEIENRFRYFKRASDFREIASVYNGLKTKSNQKPTALELEKALEKSAADGSFNRLSPGDRRNGWAASVFLNTCGRQPDHRHASCKLENGDEYFIPRKANVLLRVSGIPGGSCEWRIDGAVVDRKPCDKDASASNIRYDEPHTVSVQPAGGAAITNSLLLKDFLILSFGDSYSSGEGNPEQPIELVSYSFNDYNRSSRIGPIVQHFPVREDMGTVQPFDRKFFGDLAASWTNTQCHRSLYSQHTKAALHYALEHPHLSVTYANYSCTGAQVYEGILNAWRGRDEMRDNSFDDAPQLVKALRDLCGQHDRYSNTDWTKDDPNDADFDSKVAVFPPCPTAPIKKIDAILLSIGGNDVGFAKMIVNSAVDAPRVFPKARSLIYGLWRKAEAPQTFATGLTLANSLIPAGYRVLSAQLTSKLSVAPDKIVLSAYPDASTDESGEICKLPNVGMDVHSILGMKNPKASLDLANFTKQFHQIMQTESHRQGWRFADQYLVETGAPNSFTRDVEGKGHGLCARGPAPSIEGQVGFPRPPETPGAPPFKWEPFSPVSWRAYSERNRWLVTPDDAFLTTNYHQPDTDPNDEVQPLYAALLSGSFHPNALGHSAIADSVLIELRKVLGE
jgi:hypothetical protein